MDREELRYRPMADTLIAETKGMYLQTIRLLTAPVAFVLLLAISGLAQKQKTDRETDGLKGLVKSVFTERADLKRVSRKLVETKRRSASEYTYDKAGNRLTWKSYDYLTGDLFDSVIYSRIDGEKVSIYQDVANPNKITAMPDPEKTPQKPFDPRFDYKFTYKYDNDGNVSEKAMIQSNGDLWLRYVYNYKPGQREKLVYSDDGSLNQKYIYKLDDKGNEIEMIAYDVATDKPNGKETYKYLRFDAKGNWTKRIVFAADDTTGPVLKPREALYRKLTYY
ncbi:MAG: hypothetical protein HS105_00350 [Chloracidobacterium sp.]|nr:hypothetical protein [Chloracidobacterium sp.]MCO5332462.1 hypothetical protein [Pyrinomonadaceae bacterium]